MVNLKRNYEINKYRSIVEKYELFLFCMLDNTVNKSVITFVKENNCGAMYLNNGILKYGTGLSGKNGSLFMIYFKDKNVKMDLISVLEKKYKLSIVFLMQKKRLMIYEYYKNKMVKPVNSVQIVNNIYMRSIKYMFIRTNVLMKLMYLIRCQR